MIPYFRDYMKILAIETSCDETALAVLESTTPGTFIVLGEALYSQAARHAEYGGVYPNLAKREHQENLVPLTTEVLKQAGLFTTSQEKSTVVDSTVSALRDPLFIASVQAFLAHTKKPALDAIVVTSGPGLEPALWTGVSFAEALGKAWGVPVYGIDHMEGHLVSGMVEKSGDATYTLRTVQFPILGLLISGGHTEFVLMDSWFSYTLVGKTKDDAVGEAYDKVARLLDLPYPGGPHVDALAQKAEATGATPHFALPRPMLADPSSDFSFSGLKTAVLYTIKKHGTLSDDDRMHLAHEFQRAVVDVFVSKTRRALTHTNAQTFLVGGGVSANTAIRSALATLLSHEFPDVVFGYPALTLTGDNALMIGMSALLRAHHKKLPTPGKLTARGSQTLAPHLH